MYLTKGHGYYRGTEQHTMRGRFLLLLHLKDGKCDADNTFAVVRKVALHQLGHFMMGRANLCGKWVTISGAYGNDGLPMDVKELPKDAVKLPRRLYDLWAKGGGHNSVGSEAQEMRKWALEGMKNE
jgi:hypothetical protein